jgi:hypothetical protein
VRFYNTALGFLIPDSVARRWTDVFGSVIEEKEHGMVSRQKGEEASACSKTA